MGKRHEKRHRKRHRKGIEKGMEQQKELNEKNAKLYNVKVAQQLVEQGVSKDIIAKINKISESELEEWLLMKI
jgi:hypothetical protein